MHEVLNIKAIHRVNTGNNYNSIEYNSKQWDIDQITFLIVKTKHSISILTKFIGTVNILYTFNSC